MATYKGILLFASVFQAKQVKDASGQPTGDPKFSASLLFPPTDPQIAQIQATVDEAERTSFPSGFPAKGDKCFGKYSEKFAGKDYYDPRFADFYVLSTTAKENDRPSVVDMGLQPVIDANSACSGAVVYMNAGISGYTKGTGGIGGWLNGIMVTEEEMPYGRLDGKPSVEQMFANVGNTPAPQQQVQTAPPPTPPPAPNQAPPPPPAQYMPTVKAGNSSVDEMLAWEGWTEELLLQHGYIQKPSFA